MFCPMQKLAKSTFIEKWKSMSKETKFRIVRKFLLLIKKGKTYSNKEASIIRKLQANNIMGCAMKSSLPEVINLYMCCTSRSNILTLFELVLLKSNHVYAEIKYKSESNSREVDFENFMTLLLSEEEVIQEIDVACR